MRRPPDQARSIAEYLPRGGHLAALLAAARRLEAIDRLLPGVLGLGEASGLRAVRVTARCVTLGTDAPGRAYRLRYARQALLDAIRRLPGLGQVERVEVRTLAAMPGSPLPAPQPSQAAARVRRPPDAAALRAAASDCKDPGLRAVLERLALRARERGPA